MKKSGLVLFLIGLFTKTQIGVVGYIGISELVVFLAAPFIFFKDARLLRHDGFMTYLRLVFLVMGWCWLSSWVNGGYVVSLIKVEAAVYALFAHIVVLHRLLRPDPSKIKWLFLGIAFSTVISIFIFQPGSAMTDYDMSREALTESVTGYALFWVNLVSTYAMLPIQMSYLTIPFAYSLFAPLACAFYALLTTSSGRSSFLVAMSSFAILILGGKKRVTIAKIRKNFVAVFVFFSVAALGLATFYKIGAKSGLLGEAMKEKYEVQTEGRKSGILGTLMGGRMETFVGGYVALHHPIFGIGPKGADRDGLVNEFLAKYGTDKDIRQHEATMAMLMKQGGSFATVSAHSHIVAFWLWCGWPGVVFWLYALFLMFTILRRYMDVIPQWFGLLAVAIPSITWGILFSPFGDRTGVVLLLTCCLFVRAVAQGKVQLPPHMIREINSARG